MAMFYLHVWTRLYFIFYVSFSDDIYTFKNNEEEKTEIIPIDNLPDNIISNLKWLIPLALDSFNLVMIPKIWVKQ